MSAETEAKPHTADYDPSMTGQPHKYYCRRCRRYVGRSHVEDMDAGR